MKKILTRQEDVCIINLEYAECAEEICVIGSKTISEDENADYWCGKDVGGLIKMLVGTEKMLTVKQAMGFNAKSVPI